MHSPLAQIFPRSKETVFLSTWLLTTQLRLAWGWLRGRFTVRVQELEASPNVLLCSHSLGSPLISQVTFRSSVAPEALHSRVTLYQTLSVSGAGAQALGSEATKLLSFTYVENIACHC